VTEPVSLQCVACGRRVGSPYLTSDQLRMLTGFRHEEGNDWCGECSAAVHRFAGAADEPEDG
jgi:hypothetical protein